MHRLPLFLLLSLLCGALPAHDTELPLMARQGLACVVDLHQEDGSLALELKLRRPDALKILGEGVWRGAASQRELLRRLEKEVRVNGAAPLKAELRPPAKDAELAFWLRFGHRLPAPFELRLRFFDSLPGPAWIQAFDFLPGAEDPGERNFILAATRPLRWPALREGR